MKIYSKHAFLLLLSTCTLFLGACAGTVTKPSANWKQRTGQVQFTALGKSVIGEIAIRHSDTSFVADISKGSGALATVSSDDPTGDQVVLKGPITWRGKAEKAPAALVSLALVPKAFRWAENLKRDDLSTASHNGTTFSRVVAPGGGVGFFSATRGDAKVVCHLTP